MQQPRQSPLTQKNAAYAAQQRAHAYGSSLGNFGHGRICDKNAVIAFRGYLDWIYDEARKRVDAGLSYEDAAYDIDLAPYEHLNDCERLVLNLAALYREFGRPPPTSDPLEVWHAMARFRARRRRTSRA